MALSNLTTPGVYIQELNSFPPSIAPVATAIPAFIGYTEKGPKNAPTRITSLLDYESTFGGPFHELYTATIDANGNPTITPVSITPADTESPYLLYYHLQMYFGNGGGPCYIVSVGNYDLTAVPVIDAANLLDGINKTEMADEVTLLIVPEAMTLKEATTVATDGKIKEVYDAMLAQCNKLKDRFCIFDVKTRGVSVFDDGDKFRNNNVGANYLNYGSAYYPPLNTTLTRSYSDDEVIIVNTPVSLPFNYTVAPNNKLSTVHTGIGTFITCTVSQTTSPKLGDYIDFTVGSTVVRLSAGTDFPVIPATDDEIAAAIINSVNNHPVLSTVARAEIRTSTDSFFLVARKGDALLSVSVATSNTGWLLTPTGSGDAGPGVNNSQNATLYGTIKTMINNRLLVLAPSATMAGIYAAVDNDRGVWKAPANVGVNVISGPSVMVTESQQGGLNVDATSGKSINVIRTFVGRGTLVWGTRTLDGNSNEWCYVPVRRLFIFAETSVKNAAEAMVFEPNDKNTWLRIKGMIDNFLTDLWKQGALAGDKPEQAFFVRVGLNDTMTPQDILEGKLIVTIGLAAVRPAEFIILQFVQQLQQA
ncbi:MAG TPA: phage tail sheath C-terminal domain-containing protein [Bacteroidia bacterium]|jgi:phage tail sheath protein FI|nr:phage tail sheath C-terminal domain-containing protein [Bacteroidia bacterium]